MNEHIANSKILHFHIPKTAGTALRHYFCRQIGAEHVSPGLVGLRLGEALARYARFDVISGHFSLYQGDRLPDDRLSLTVVRDPVDRFLSDFFFKKAAQDSRPNDVSRRESSLDEHIEDSRNSSGIDSLVQIAMLYPLGADPVASLTIEEKTATAIRALDQFHLVGTQEEIDDFACMISAQAGWPQRPVPRSNVTSRRVTIDDLTRAQRTAIERLLEFEIELYRAARERFKNDRRASISAHKTTVSAAPAQSSAPIPAIPREFGDRRCEMLAVRISGEISGPGPFLSGERLNLDIRFAAHEAIGHLTAGISIRDMDGSVMYGTNSRLLGNDYAVGPGEHRARFSFFNRLGVGHYSLTCALQPTGSHHDGCYHWKEEAATFEVYGCSMETFEGRLLLDTEFELAASSANPDDASIAVSALQSGLRAFGRMNEPLREFLSAIEPLAQIRKLHAGTDTLIPVRLSNLGEETWRAMGRNPVCLSYRWYGTDGKPLVTDGLRTTLPADVTGGETVMMPLQVRVPAGTGTYTLAVSPVQEAIAWFMDKKAESCYTCSVVVA